MKAAYIESTGAAEATIKYGDVAKPTATGSQVREVRSSDPDARFLQRLSGAVIAVQPSRVSRAWHGGEQVVHPVGEAQRGRPPSRSPCHVPTTSLRLSRRCHQQ